MTTYFKAINNDGNTIIDDSTSRFALIRKLPLSSMSATLTVDAWWDSSNWLSGTLDRIAPPAEKRIERVLRYDFDVTDSEIVVGFINKINDSRIGVFVERTLGYTNRFSFFVILGEYRTSFQGDTDDFTPIEIANNIIVCTFGLTKNATSMNIMGVVHHPLEDKAGLKIINSLGECVFHSSCRYLDVIGDIKRKYTFSSGRKDLSELPDIVDTEYSKDCIIIPNLNAMFLNYILYSSAFRSYCPSVITYSINGGKIILRAFTGYVFAGFNYMSFIYTSDYYLERIHPMGLSNTISCVIANSDVLEA